MTTKRKYDKDYHAKYHQRNKEKRRLQSKEYKEQYGKTLFYKVNNIKNVNKIKDSKARIMAFKATYPECQNCGCSTGKIGVDHDHETGMLRGILCNSCNRKDVFNGKDVQYGTNLQYSSQYKCAR